MTDEIVSEMKQSLSGDVAMALKLDVLLKILNQTKMRKDEQEEELTVIHNTQENLMY